jgi:hypothetical protein
MNEPNPVLVNNGLAKARAAKAAKREAKLKAEAAGADAPQGDVVTPEVLTRKSRVPRDPVHAPTRTPVRAGRIEALGRNNEVLSRRRTSTGDIFDIPKHLIPDGWEYQWCAVSVVGNTEILLDQNLMFAENGWRAVPASRYPGKFMPAGHKGSILRGGQMLMERPKSLSDEARADDVRAAKQLISDRNESLKLSGVRKAMGDGFEMSGKYRGTGGNIRMSIDRALDAPVPARQLADE